MRERTSGTKGFASRLAAGKLYQPQRWFQLGDPRLTQCPESSRRRLESFEPEHRRDPLLYAPVILLDQIVQIFAGSHLNAAR
jgi:hypothetical protein